MKKLPPILLAFTGLSCQKSPEGVLEKYFEIANNVVNGDTTEISYLKEHLFKSATARIDSLPLLMQNSLLFLTKNGQLVNTKMNRREEITKDSMLIDIDLNYVYSSGKNIQQAMIFEDNEWKLGISHK